MGPKAKFRPRQIRIEIPDTSITCPYCKVLSRFVDTSKSVFDENKGVWSILQCIGCKGPVLAIYRWTGSYALAGNEVGVPVVEPKPARVFPESEPSVHKSIPQPVAEAYKESIVCYNVGAWKGSAILCRRALQASIVDKGADVKKRLRDQIHELATRQIITQDISNWAHTIRLLGNDGAHPYNKGSLTNVTKSDLDEMLRFMESYLKYVYEMPYEVAKKSRRQ
jgi:hypothetical protein